MHNTAVLLALILFLFPEVQGQTPLVEHYRTDLLGADENNWQITQGPQGYIYVANQRGLLLYDGSSWELMEVPGRTVRSVAIDDKNNVLIGTATDIGMLETDSTGLRRYRSLTTPLEDDHQPSGAIFNLHSAAGRSYAETQTAIYTLTPGNSSYSITAHPLDEYIVSSNVIYDTLYVVSAEFIYQQVDGEPRRIRHSKVGTLGFINAIYPIGEDDLLVVTNKNFLIRYDNGLDGIGEVWNSPLQNYIRATGTQFYFGANQLSASDLAFGEGTFVWPTLNSGLLITDASGNLRDVLTDDSGLGSNTIYDTFIDREGNYWLATNRGITKVLGSIPILKYQTNLNLGIPINSLAQAGGLLYLGTDNGVLAGRLGADNFALVPGTESQIWSIKPWKEGVLVAGGNAGLYYLVGNQLVDKISTYVSALSIDVHPQFPGIIFTGLYNGLDLYTHNENGFAWLHSPPEVTGDIRTVAATKEGDVWAGSKYSGIYRLQLAYRPTDDGVRIDSLNVKRYTRNHGLREMEHTMVYRLHDRELFSSRSGLYTFDAASDRFRPLITGWAGRVADYPVLESDASGRIWITDQKMIAEGWNSDASSIDTLSLRGFKGEINDFLNLDDETTLIASNLGLYGLIQSKFSRLSELPRLTIRSLKRDGKRLTLPTQNGSLSLPYASRQLELQLALPSYLLEEQNRFRIKVEGWNSSAGSWQSNPLFGIGPLTEGNYVVKAEAVDVFGEHYYTDLLSLTILPPWYRTFWAYLLYLLSAGLLIGGYVRFKNYRLLRRNEYLEAVVSNRTEEINTQKRDLEQKADQLAKADRLKNQLIEMAVHEMRNPLSAIVGLSDLIDKEGKPSDDIREWNSEIERVADNMLDMVDDLLNQRKAELELRELNRQPVEPGYLIREVVQLNQVQAAKKHQKMTTRIDFEGTLMTDRKRLFELVDNLLNNAIKYAPTHTEITVELSRANPVNATQSSTAFARIAISDQGPGIEPDERERIFEPFYTSDAKPTGGEYSTGLGLHIAKMNIEAMGGTIWVESNSDSQSGSTFIIELPIAKSVS